LHHLQLTLLLLEYCQNVAGVDVQSESYVYLASAKKWDISRHSMTTVRSITARTTWGKPSEPRHSNSGVQHKSVVVLLSKLSRCYTATQMCCRRDETAPRVTWLNRPSRCPVPVRTSMRCAAATALRGQRSGVAGEAKTDNYVAVDVH